MADFTDEQKQFVDTTVEYLEQNDVYDLFDSMTQELLLHQPESPIKFLIEYLSRKPAPKILLISPPGVCNRSSISHQLADKYGVPVISAAPGKEDEILNKMKESIFTGYIVDGFPTSRVDTLKMLVKKIVPDRIIMLHVPEESLLSTINVARSGEPISNEEMEVRQFYRHIVGVLQLVGPQTHQINIEGLDESQIFNAIVSRVAMKHHSHAPFRPHRVCLVGPPASGRRELAKELADIVGAVHVDVPALLRDTAQRNPGLPVSKQIDACMLNGELLSDSTICALIEERLRHADCASRGWILDGFPLNEVQANHLRISKLLPTRAVVLTSASDLVRENLATKLTDPVTGFVYNNSTANGLEVSVRNRLVRSNNDSDPHTIERRVANSSNAAKAISSVFPKIADIIPLGGAHKSTLDRIRDFVERPIVSLGSDGENSMN